MVFATPWTIQSMEFSKPEYWSGQPFPSPEDLPKPGIEPRSPALQTDSLPAEPQGKPKYWSGQPIPSPGDLSKPGIEPRSPALQADSLPLSHQGNPLYSKENHKKKKKQKRQSIEWEKLFANDITEKHIFSKICTQLIHLNNNKKQPR